MTPRIMSRSICAVVTGMAGSDNFASKASNTLPLRSSTRVTRIGSIYEPLLAIVA